jgi:ppGpp synthetase/RelA/SpoT-type nucleotidyltranferase
MAQDFKRPDSPGTKGANPNSTELPLGDNVDGKLIRDFITKYSDSGICLYEHLTHGLYEICRDGLSEVHSGGPLGSRGIKAELYTRPSLTHDFRAAKTPKSMERTLVRRRATRKTPFEFDLEIYQMMYDMSAITIALYYPNDLQQVKDFIHSRFEVVATREWPDFANIDPKLGKVPYAHLRAERQFPGYVGSHFIVKLRDSDLRGDKNARLRDRLAEIQVKSLIMWAWQKVHHELIYKPGTGFRVDQDDERMVDLSNGIIMADESALRHMQINLNRKRQESHAKFNNAYSMMDYISTKWIENESKPAWLKKYRLSWWYQNILFNSLQEFDFNKPNRLNKLIEGCEELLGTDEDNEGEHDLLARILYKLSKTQDVKQRISCIVPGDSDTPRFSVRGRRIRYKLWLVSHTLKWLHSSYFTLQLSQDIIGGLLSKVKARPPLRYMLRILYPFAPLRDINPSEGGFDTLREVFDEIETFCDQFLEYDTHFRFLLAVALTKLTWYVTPSGDVRQHAMSDGNPETVLQTMRTKPTTTSKVWTPVSDETFLGLETIAACPIQLIRFASDVTPPAKQPPRKRSPDRPFQQGTSSESEELEYRHIPRQLDRVSGRRRKRAKTKPKDRAEQVTTTTYKYPAKDVTIIPYNSQLDSYKCQWNIVASMDSDEDWFSNCVRAGFDAINAYRTVVIRDAR